MAPALKNYLPWGKSRISGARSVSTRKTRRRLPIWRAGWSSWSRARDGRSKGCTASVASWTRSFAASPCRTPSNERRLDHREARIVRILHLAGGVRVPGDLPAAHRVLHLHRGQLLRARGSEPRRVLRLASVDLPRARARGRDAALGGGAPLGHARAAAHHARDHLAGDRREVSRELGVPRPRARADVSGDSDGQYPGRSG